MLWEAIGRPIFIWLPTKPCQDLAINGKGDLTIILYP
jgi:hypothetical protein